MKMIFISSPYKIGDTAINVRRQLDCADKLMDLGFCPIVPLESHFQHLVFPRKYSDWLKIDFEKIKRCDAVIRLTGKSEGADKETIYAKKMNIPVFYSIQKLWRFYNR